MDKFILIWYLGAKSSRTEINLLKTKLFRLRRGIDILELANEKQEDDNSDFKLFENLKFNI